MTRTPHRGFTLMEVIVALTIAALLVVGARGLLEAIGGQAQAVLRFATAADRRLNARTELRRLVADLEPMRDSLPSMEGDGDSTAFRSRCVSEHGWTEPCDVMLRVEAGTQGRRVTLTAQDRRAVIGDSLSAAAIRYLTSAIAGGRWIESWQGTIGIPVGLGIIMNGDTLFMPIGDRR
jgi:prepilin-type N-terminal cleavage/methylation domain-containing protein